MLSHAPSRGLRRCLTPEERGPSLIPHDIRQLVDKSLKIGSLLAALFAEPTAENSADQAAEYIQIQAQALREQAKTVLDLNFEAITSEFYGEKIASLDSAPDEFDPFERPAIAKSQIFSFFFCDIYREFWARSFLHYFEWFTSPVLKRVPG